MKDLKQRIERQVELLTQEQQRVKIFVNESGFDCTTAPYIMVKEYRDRLKQHIHILRMNLEDL